MPTSATVSIARRCRVGTLPLCTHSGSQRVRHLLFPASPLFCQEFADAYATREPDAYQRHRHEGSIMAPRAPHSTARPAYGAFDADEHYAHDEFLPGERIGRPLRRTGGKALLRGLIILIAFGGGWALVRGPARLPQTFSAAI